MQLHKSFWFRTAYSCAICAATFICLQADLAWAQKGKPGGGISSNAAIATLDPIANTLRISGDGSDQVEVGTDVLVGGSFTLDGGKRTDKLSISPELFDFSNVTGFESVLFW